MIISSLTKVKSLDLATTIASTFISALSIFAAVDLNNQAKAIVVAGDPDDYIARLGTGYDGVTLLISDRTNSPTTFCTGSLLPTGFHILTAAHCLTETTDNLPFGGIPGNFNTRSTRVGFELPALASNQGFERFGGISAAEFYVHPDWNGDFLNSNDVAIIKLSQEAPATNDRYDINRAKDELGQVVTKVGYGASGNGNTGATIQDYVKRSGQNIYDVFVDTPLDPGSQQILGYDFDNGLVANDFFGYFGFPNTGLGLNEVISFSGDSGGPGLINNLVAGISSFSASPGTIPSDVDGERNGSFGEYSADTRVSSYASYIDDVLAGKIEPTYKVPEPSTVLGSILALGAFAISSLFRRTEKQKLSNKTL